MNASLFYRITAVLLLLFAVGHTLGFRQSDPTWGVDPLIGSMRSIHFDVQGFSRTYWDLFGRGWILGRRVISIRGGISVAARWPSGRDFSGHARHCVGTRSLLCCHHGRELEIPLYPPYRFLNRDYRVFDCSRLAFSEANLKPFVRVCFNVAQLAVPDIGAGRSSRCGALLSLKLGRCRGTVRKCDIGVGRALLMSRDRRIRQVHRTAAQ